MSRAHLQTELLGHRVCVWLPLDAAREFLECLYSEVFSQLPEGRNIPFTFCNLIAINYTVDPSTIFKNILLIFRGRGRRKRERNINVWLPLAHPPLGTWPTTQTCALTGSRTGDPLVFSPMLNPLSYTSQGLCTIS